MATSPIASNAKKLFFAKKRHFETEVVAAQL
jgi:hypothetical protein